MIMKKKGQAAIEFLMTYGWAILVVLIVISSLAFFLSRNDPDDLIAKGCNQFSTPGVLCADYRVVGDIGTNTNATIQNKATATFILQANLKDIKITGFNARKQGNATDLCGIGAGKIAYDPEGDNSSDPPSLLQKGQSVTIACIADKDAFGTQGETVTLDLELEWKENSPTALAKVDSSSLLAVVQ